MATKIVTFSCGHEGELRLSGPYKDRERKVQWAQERGLCPDCYKAWKRKEAEKEEAEWIAHLKEVEASLGLPEPEWPALEGTPKQIAWAERIREQFVRDFATLYERALRYAPEELRQALLRVRQELANQVKASWWIDHRGERTRDLVERMPSYREAVAIAKRLKEEKEKPGE